MASLLVVFGLVGCGSSDSSPDDGGKPGEQPKAAAKEENPAAVAAYDKGVAAERSGDFGGAREHFIQARVHAPGFRDTEERLDSLGAILMAKLGYEEAQESGDEGQQATSAVAYANALRDRSPGARDLNRSSELLAEATQKNPDDAEAYYLLSIVAAERGDLAGAAEHANTALEKNADHAASHYQLAFVHRVWEGGDAAMSLEHAQAAVDKASEPQGQYYELLAVCQADSGDTEAAIGSLEKAIEVDAKPRYEARLKVWKPEPEPAPEPPADDPPADDPPADDPPADDPPADDPPADDPPADDPPADDPPADEPPADEPPVEQPPADEPPADDPPAGDDDDDDLPGMDD
jgi:tetratricopeptide (TPR) repeat protein